MSNCRGRSLIPWVLLGAGAAYAVWSRAGRHAPALPERPDDYTLRSVGVDAGTGNLLGIQPWLEPADYASISHLFSRLDGYFAAAAAGGLIGEKTVVILPEYLGTWLAAVGEKTGVYQAKTLREAMSRVIAANLPQFLTRLPQTREVEWTMAAVIRMKAAAMAAGYHGIMSALTRRYRVHLVAGSIVLPEPRIRDGALVAGHGKLYNVTPVYAPDGGICPPLIHKIFPTEEELPAITAGRVDDLAAFETPAGRLGVLICADSWYPAGYTALRAQRVELIAVPSFNTLASAAPWPGYSGAPAPDDVNPADIGRLTNARAWNRYALAPRIAQSGARAGMNVFYRGVLWDMHLSGHATVVSAGSVTEFPDEDDVALINLWV